MKAAASPLIAATLLSSFVLGAPGCDTPVADRASLESSWVPAGAPVRTAYLRTGDDPRPRALRYSDVNGLAVFQGDILLGPVARLPAQPGDVSAQGIATSVVGRRWPKAQVPYTVDPSLPNPSRVAEALQHWQERTNVRFILRDASNAQLFPNYVAFVPGTGCGSYVGMIGGQQPIILQAECSTGNTIHEIGHAVGLWHEQSREDRNHFVRIRMENVQAGTEHNFDQHIADGDDLGGYDYGSIMHYGAYYFSSNGQPTIEVLTPGATIGQSNVLSAGDIQAALVMYPSPPTCLEVRARNPAAQDGTYPLTVGGRQVSVYCHDMAGTPREYLTLPNTGSTTNYSYYGNGSNTSAGGQTTWYTKARLNPAMLSLTLDDSTFATSQGWMRFGSNYHYTNPLGSAGDCVSDLSSTGRSNINLTGTPFDIVPSQFQLHGWMPGGVESVHSSQNVTLHGGGFCGGLAPPDNTLRLNVRPAAAATPGLVHRYSFSTGGVDSVGGAHAVLVNGATVANGELVLNGTGAYANLPIGATLATLQDASIEAWVKWDSNAAQAWARIFDFNNNAQAYMFLTPSNGGAMPRFAITTTLGGGEQMATSSTAFPVGQLTHVAVTLDSAAGLTRLYVNGTEVARKSTTLTPSSLGATQNNWLGRSLYAADAYFKGSISEFRVYRTALSPSRIGLNASAGPDRIDPDLVHRYSFSTSEVDSVGGAHAVLVNGATVANGELVLNGTGAYANLPIGATLATLQDASIEAWVKWDSSAAQSWARIFDFNNNAQAYMFLTPSSGGAMPRFAITTTLGGGEQMATSTRAFPEGQLTHVAVTFDSAVGLTRLYVNGTEVARKNTTLTPSSLGATQNNWLGRSLYTADAYFKGSISEFRVYRAALSPSRIGLNASAGPDAVNL